jgi:hypothetical protein
MDFFNGEKILSMIYLFVGIMFVFMLTGVLFDDDEE